MNEQVTSVCAICGNACESEFLCGPCVAMRDAAAPGAPPNGVPLRIYGGYLEARAALRANAPAAATRVLQWLLGHLAEERGVPSAQSLSTKINKLCSDGVISPRVQNALFDRALSSDDGPEQAWALMSIVEHVFYRLYLSKPS